MKEEKVLILDSTQYTKELNALLQKEFEENKIDTYPDYTYDTYYIDFATGDNWGYMDEYNMCSECHRVIRIDENGYGFIPMWIGDGFCMCEDCVKENPDEYLDYLIDDCEHANLILNEKELNGHGFYKLNDEHYANGFYGRHDNPVKIYQDIKNEKPDAKIIFSLYQNYNPYEEEFDIYIKE